MTPNVTTSVEGKLDSLFCYSQFIPASFTAPRHGFRHFSHARIKLWQWSGKSKPKMTSVILLLSASNVKDFTVMLAIASLTPSSLYRFYFWNISRAFLPDHSLIEDKAQHISTNIKFWIGGLREEHTLNFASFLKTICQDSDCNLMHTYSKIPSIKCGGTYFWVRMQRFALQNHYVVIVLFY